MIFFKDEINNLEIKNFNDSLFKSGCDLIFKVFKSRDVKFQDVPTKYEKHLGVARSAIVSINHHFNQHILNQIHGNKNSGYEIPKLYKTDFGKLDTSGKKIDNFNFLGAMNIEIQQKLTFKVSLENFKKNKAFVHAFLYGVNRDSTVEKLNKVIDYYFNDFKNTELYSWSTDCSPFFDAGKSWWGCYFWTVYNPEKNWYVAILGSSID